MGVINIIGPEIDIDNNARIVFHPVSKHQFSCPTEYLRGQYAKQVTGLTLPQGAKSDNAEPSMWVLE